MLPFRSVMSPTVLISFPEVPVPEVPVPVFVLGHGFFTCAAKEFET